MNLRYGSVCSGVEAATLAWRKLGWKPAFFAEVEPFPCAVLQQKLGATRPVFPLDPEEAHDEKDRRMRVSWMKKNNMLSEDGNVINWGDFTKIEGEKYRGTIDILVGGTPCQDLSTFGKRLGFDGLRSVLATSFIALAYRAGVRWIVWENVVGALSSNFGHDFATFLSILCGYKVGVPEEGWKNAGIIENLNPYRFGGGWRVLDAQYTRTPGFPHAVPQRRRRILFVGYFGDWIHPAKVLFRGEALDGCIPARKNTTGNSEDLFRTTPKSEFRRKTYGLNIHSSEKVNHIVDEEISPTLLAEHNMDLLILEGDKASFRKQTPIETERLMGFPDNWTRIKWSGRPEEECPDGPRYKCCGNSMCVNVMEWIGRRIDQVEREEGKR